MHTLFVIKALQVRVELQQEEDILEVLHEFRIVNLAITLRISQQVQSVALGHCHSQDAHLLLKASLILRPL